MRVFESPQINQGPKIPLVFPFGDPKEARSLKEFSYRLLALVCQQFMEKDRVLNEKLLAEVDLFIFPFWKPFEGQWFDKVEATISDFPHPIFGDKAPQDTLTLLFHNPRQEGAA